jgi:hypothetical protein
MSEAPSGFGGRTFRADGPLSIWVNPLERTREDGSTGITLGFRLGTLTATAGEDETLAAQLAEYLSCPKRAAAHELYEALLEMVMAAEGAGLDSRSRRKNALTRGLAALAKARGGA